MRSRTAIVAVVALAAALALAGTGAALADDATQAEDSETNGTVNVTTGQQLSTVIVATSDEIEAEVDDTAFEIEWEEANETERAVVLAERAAELEDRAGDLQAEYENATAAYESGEITREEYAQRLATLNARAEQVVESADEVETRQEHVTELELEVAGMSPAEFNATIGSLEELTGPGHQAVLERFTGERSGDIELELDAGGGVSLEIEGEDGERSRELRRPRDDSTNLTVSQTAALETANAALSTDVGEWVLTSSSVHEDDGYYRFRYALNATAESGEAEVRVDGSSGDVFRIEEELEAPESDDDDDDEGDDDAAAASLNMLVHSGTVDAGETVTLQVLKDGEPAANVSVELNSTVVGETDANGTVEVTLPETDADIRAEDGESEDRLEFEFGDDDGNETDDDQAADGSFDVATSLDDGVATTTVTFDGEPVPDADVFVESEHVGQTDANGTVTYEVNATEDFELTIVYGVAEIETTYAIADGSVSVVDDEVEVEGAAEVTFG